MPSGRSDAVIGHTIHDVVIVCNNCLNNVEAFEREKSKVSTESICIYLTSICQSLNLYSEVDMLLKDFGCKVLICIEVNVNSFSWLLSLISFRRKCVFSLNTNNQLVVESPSY
ncbi:hypothetical protein NBO_31g0003 [Nosema bombycis CQ1]|uniref:Uncharacterized protein n=1 Tax=Nosema bombycis (strain CQ1 / CVCC 102059) TaxID=578461 RepID=R0MN42_NOSB1|nr:hypothetical protein NBO_31g0003 [Nosema bombycis CQ1]|eukprot:EOB14283.1 hypothetical protein NBO_31g0003 [Nosema bombycis CQ1]